MICNYAGLRANMCMKITASLSIVLAVQWYEKKKKKCEWETLFSSTNISPHRKTFYVGIVKSNFKYVLRLYLLI